MKSSIAGFLVAAVAFAIVGAGLLIASRVDQHLADAQEQMATLQYDRATESLDAAAASLTYGRWLPSVGDRTLREIEARRAALQYWQGRYDSVLPAQAEPVAAVDEANVELQLVVANAAFRVGLSGAKERAATVQALNDAANGYLTVLKNDTWHEDAAHNYEFVVRLRDEVQKGRRPASAQQQQGQELGESGAPAPATSMKGFEIYIPREGDEKSPEGGDAGKATPTQRKG
jgi:hypothetical protein